MRRLILFAACLIVATAAFAQKGNIGFVYPAGAQRGTVVEVTVGGQGLSRAQQIIFSGKGVTGELIPAPKGAKPAKRKNKNIGEEDNLQLADQVKFRVTVDKDAELGLRDVRLVLPNGMTNRLYFEVGQLPDVLESPKDEISAVSETLPVTFNGQVMRSDVDRFRFRAKAGAQLVLQVKGRYFVPYMADAVPGWFQPIIRLYGPDGKEVAFNDDYRHEVDPVLIFKVPKTGDYDVEINDALYRGREDFVYRIDVGELPFITSISPIGGPVGQKTTITLRGVNLGRKPSVSVFPSKSGKMDISFKPGGKKGLVSNTVLFEADDRIEAKVAKVSNTSMQTAFELKIGEVVEQTISEPLQQRWYKVNVEKKRPYNMEVFARRLGAPSDMRISVFSRSGEKLFDIDDTEDESECRMTHFADPQKASPLAPGTYFIRLTEAQGKGGEEYSYRFSIGFSKPDFTLRLEPSTFSVPENGTGIFNVFLSYRQGFRKAVNIRMDGLPKGCKVSGNHLAPGQRKAIVTVTAPQGTEHKTFFPKVRGEADGGISHEAVPVESMMQAFYYTHMMPIDEFRMEVGEELPFAISIVKNWKGDRLVLSREHSVPIKVRIERGIGFTSPVTLMLKSSEGAVKAEAVVIPEGESEAVMEVILKGKAKREIRSGLLVAGVVKGSSGRIAGKGRQAFVASITAYTQPVEIFAPAYKGQ